MPPYCVHKCIIGLMLDIVMFSIGGKTDRSKYGFSNFVLSIIVLISSVFTSQALSQ